MVLVVSEVYARGYGAGRARVGSTRSQERLVVYSDSGAAVGVEEADAAKGKGLNRLLRGRVWKWRFYVGMESPAHFCPARPLGTNGVSRKRGSVLPGSVSGRRSIHFPVGGVV